MPSSHSTQKNTLTVKHTHTTQIRNFQHQMIIRRFWNITFTITINVNHFAASKIKQTHVQHVSDVNTSILRSLRLMCWVISWVVLIWFDVCWCYVVEPYQYNPWNKSAHKSQAPEDGCINIRNMLSIKQRNNKASDLKLVSLYSTIKMMHGPINIRDPCHLLIWQLLILNRYSKIVNSAELWNYAVNEGLTIYDQLTFHCFVQSLDWQRSVWEHG